MRNDLCLGHPDPPRRFDGAPIDVSHTGIRPREHGWDRKHDERDDRGCQSYPEEQPKKCEQSERWNSSARARDRRDQPLALARVPDKYADR